MPAIPITSNPLDSGTLLETDAHKRMITAIISIGRNNIKKGIYSFIMSLLLPKVASALSYGDSFTEFEGDLCLSSLAPKSIEKGTNIEISENTNKAI